MLGRILMLLIFMNMLVVMAACKLAGEIDRQDEIDVQRNRKDLRDDREQKRGDQTAGRD